MEITIGLDVLVVEEKENTNRNIRQPVGISDGRKLLGLPDVN